METAQSARNLYLDPSREAAARVCCSQGRCASR